MYNKKICFIMCSNNELLAEECLKYIMQLELPNGYQLETMVVYEAMSAAAGYNQAMKQSDAKYKIYLHQDVLIVNRRFLVNIINLFLKHPEIGMLGVMGNKSLDASGCPWGDGMWRRVGKVYIDLVYQKVLTCFGKVAKEFEKVVVLDGLLMATQYDLPWREDLFGGWDFYDCSQSLEFWKQGYQVIVPYLEQPWCLHDNDVLHLQNYDQWRKIFVKEYQGFYLQLAQLINEG